MSRPIPVICDECNTPVLELRDGAILIKHHHHSELHITVKTLDTLLAMCNNKASAEVKEPPAS